MGSGGIGYALFRGQTADAEHPDQSRAMSRRYARTTRKVAVGRVTFPKRGQGDYIAALICSAGDGSWMI